MSRDTKTAPPGASAVALRTMSVRRCLRRVNSRCDRRRRGSPWLIRNRSFWSAGRSPRRPGGQRRGLRAALGGHAGQHEVPHPGGLGGWPVRGPGHDGPGGQQPGTVAGTPGVDRRAAGDPVLHRGHQPGQAVVGEGGSDLAPDRWRQGRSASAGPAVRAPPRPARAPPGRARQPGPSRSPPAADQHRVEGDQGPGQRRRTQPPPPAGELGFIRCGGVGPGPAAAPVPGPTRMRSSNTSTLGTTTPTSRNRLGTPASRIAPSSDPPASSPAATPPAPAVARARSAPPWVPAPPARRHSPQQPARRPPHRPACPAPHPHASRPRPARAPPRRPRSGRPEPASQPAHGPQPLTEPPQPAGPRPERPDAPPPGRPLPGVLRRGRPSGSPPGPRRPAVGVALPLPRSSFVRGDANDDEWCAPLDPATHAVTSRFGRHHRSCPLVRAPPILRSSHQKTR